MSAASEFRAGRALLHTLAVIVVFAIVTGIVTFEVADPKRMGKAVGSFSLVLALLTVGWSWLAQTGRRTAAMVVSGLALALMIGVVSMIVVLGKSAQDERAEQTAVVDQDLIRADGRLRHSTLGFSVPDPGPSFVPLPDTMSGKFPAWLSAKAWIYSDASAGEVFTVLLVAGAGAHEKNFGDFFGGMAEGNASGEHTIDVREQWVR